LLAGKGKPLEEQMSFFSKKKSTPMTRLFFATDIHGSERTYRKFINAGKFYNVNVIVMGGDIQGKLLIPIIKETNGHYRATLQGSLLKINTEDELKQLQERIGLLGFYKMNTRYWQISRRKWINSSTNLRASGCRPGLIWLRRG
jgi:Icc-related predicted phosphoesterase